jgi:hypothetical protein
MTTADANARLVHRVPLGRRPSTASAGPWRSPPSSKVLNSRFWTCGAEVGPFWVLLRCASRSRRFALRFCSRVFDSVLCE